MVRRTFFPITSPHGRSRTPWVLLATLTLVLLIGASCSALPGRAGETVAGEATDDQTTGNDEADDADPDDSSSEGDSGQAEGGSDTADGGRDTADRADVTEESTTTTKPEPIPMPDLVGMTDTEARAALADLGLDEPTIQTQESFDPAGLVLEQVPTAGRDVAGAINLVVATSVQPMPDFVGSTIADVRAWATERDIDVHTESELTDQLPSGQVVTQTPAPGAQPSQEIIVTVADTPVIVDLVDLGWLDSYQAYKEDIEMDGNVFPETIILASRYKTPWATFNLSRDWSTLKVDLGLSDVHAFNAVMQVEIMADGEVIYSDTVAFGAMQPVELDVTDVLRLSISAAQVQGGSTWVGLGNARLIGGAATTGG